MQQGFYVKMVFGVDFSYFYDFRMWGISYL